MKENPYYLSAREDIQPYIPSGLKRTLDVGCAKGFFSAMLKLSKGVEEAWGIEMVEECAKEASFRLDYVLMGLFDEVYTQLPDHYFDCVFLNDVLEHMQDPEDCLMKIKNKLTPKGVIIASIPNVRHVEVLRELLFRGDWEYKDSGILDRTHLRFFTKKSMERMFEKCGYDVKMIKGINGVGKFSLTNMINVLMFNKWDDVKYRQYLIKAYSK